VTQPPHQQGPGRSGGLSHHRPSGRVESARLRLKPNSNVDIESDPSDETHPIPDQCCGNPASAVPPTRPPMPNPSRSDPGRTGRDRSRYVNTLSGDARRATDTATIGYQPTYPLGTDLPGPELRRPRTWHPCHRQPTTRRGGFLSNGTYAYPGCSHSAKLPAGELRRSRYGTMLS